MADKKPDLATAIRGLIATFEIGPVNAAQRTLLEYVKEALGDAHAPHCSHSNTFYEEGDVLTCQDCRSVLAKPV